jgi:carbamoyl-phosphate synthase large subunit
MRMKTLRVFVRQPFTESGNREKEIVQDALNVLRSLDGDPYNLVVPTGFEAQSQETFRQAYERDYGKEFTPENFRATRLAALRDADAMFVIRTGLSESGSFEVAYNIFGGRRIPMFFAVWEGSPIKTTLLRELQEIADTTYNTFQSAWEIEQPLREFLIHVGLNKSGVAESGGDRASQDLLSKMSWFLGRERPREASGRSG